MTNAVRPTLPPMPPRIARLPVDDRGFPVPFFVDYVNGKPDHRLTDGRKVVECHRFGRCFICGQKLGGYKAFPVGPMCGINRVSSEPPSHKDCALWAMRGCPFLSRPHAKRRPIGDVVETVPAPGAMIQRNPGVMLVWVTKKYHVIKVPGEPGRGLFEFGDPVELEFYTEGRPATRAEVDASIAGGFGELYASAIEDDRRTNGRIRAVEALYERRLEFTQLLNRWAPPIADIPDDL